MPTCSKAEYTHPVTGVTFGMTKNELRAALKKNFPSPQYTLDERDEAWFLDFKDRSTFDRYSFHFQNDRLTQIRLSYSDDFQEKFGGSDGASVALLKKLMEKYGKMDNHEELNLGSNSGHKLVWDTKGGASLGMVTIKNLILISYDCDDLMAFLRDKAQKSANFGF